MASKGKAALTGAASGAAAGAVLGPWGAAAGGVIGGLAGYFGADDSKAPTYDPNHQNFIYGLGPSDSYANQQSNAYGSRQDQLAALGADAYNRQAPTQAMPGQIAQVQSGGQGYLQDADAAGRAQQLQALGGLQNQTGALNRFAQAPEGPSAAQATLQQGVNAAAAQQMALARAQPGGGGASLRGAAFNAGGISAQAGATAAMLRAQETQAYRGQQLQALGAAQQGAGMSAGYAGQLRGADQSFAQAQAGQANYDANAANQFNQGQQQLQYQVGANNLNAAGQARGQNDALTLGANAQSMGYDALRNNVAAQNTAQGNAYEAAKAAGAGLGSQNFNAATQQSNAETGMVLGAASGAAGAYAQQQEAEKNRQNALAVAQANANSKNPTSDVRAKTDIKPASVLQALGGKYTPEQTKQLYMQGLTERYGIPAQLAGAHDANARSQGPDRSLGEFGAAPSATDRRAQLAALGGPSLSQPDIAALDEAYRRQGGTPDLRPAQGYEYAYKDPEADGAGRYVGPMAQDLEHLPGVVEQGSDGKKAINAPRLTLANTAALSEMQRKQDELERQQQLQALGGALPSSGFVRPNLQQPDYAAFGPAGYHY